MRTVARREDGAMLVAVYGQLGENAKLVLLSPDGAWAGSALSALARGLWQPADEPPPADRLAEIEQLLAEPSAAAGLGRIRRVRLAAKHLLGQHDQHSHAGDAIPEFARDGIDILDVDRYQRLYGDVADEWVDENDEPGYGLAARWFESGDLQVAYDLPGRKHQVLSDMDAQGMEQLGRDLNAARVQAESLDADGHGDDIVWDVESDRHDFYIAVNESGEILLYPPDKQAEGDAFSLAPEDANAFVDALFDLAERQRDADFDVEYDGEEDGVEPDEEATKNAKRRKHLPGRHDQSSHGRRRSQLERAKTVEQVSGALEDEIRKLTGREVEVDFSGADVAIAREYSDGILTGLKRFPRVPLQKVATYGPGSNNDSPHAGGERAVATHVGNSELWFNAAKSADPEARRETLARDKARGWSVAGTPKGLALHEFGHVVARTGDGHPEAGISARASARAKTAGMPSREFVTAEVSQYAATSDEELTAEVFTKAMLEGDDTSPFVRSALSILQDSYDDTTSAPAPAVEDRARDRQTAIDKARSQANLLAELEELAVINETRGDELARMARVAAERFGADDPELRQLVARAEAGDAEGVEDLIETVATRLGLTRIGGEVQSRQVVRYDRDVHNMLPGERPTANVEIVRPGYTGVVNGEQVPLLPAVVAPVESARRSRVRTSPAETPASQPPPTRNLLGSDDNPLSDAEKKILGAYRRILAQRRNSDGAVRISELREVLMDLNLDVSNADVKKALLSLGQRPGARLSRLEPGVRGPFDGVLEVRVDGKMQHVLEIDPEHRDAGVFRPTPEYRARQSAARAAAPADIEAKARADFKALLRRSRKHKIGDPTLTELVKTHPGWEQSGRVVTSEELDKLIADGWAQNWRGVEGGNGRSAAKIAEENRTGRWLMGLGMFGNGVYLTPRRTTAEHFRGHQTPQPGMAEYEQGQWETSSGLHEWVGPYKIVSPRTRGGLIRMAVNPAAKLIDYQQLVAEHKDWLEGEDITSPWYAAALDPAWYAVMRGYDGIHVRAGDDIEDGADYPPGVSGRQIADQYVIFNRGVLAFEEASDRYDA